MITLLLAVIAAGTANVALVAFMADRLGPKAGASAGELVAIAQGPSVATKASALKVGNENASAGTAALAA